MKLIFFLLIALLFISACSNETPDEPLPPASNSTVTETPSQHPFQKYDDDLDAALEELELID